MNGYLFAFVIIAALALGVLFVIRDAISLDRDKAADALRALFKRGT